MSFDRWTMTRHLRRPRRTARRTWHEIVGRADDVAYRLRLRSASGLRLPDFLGIGAQKAGTTWLHNNLSAHPELFLPEQKELHHFDWFDVPTRRRYASQFRDAGDRMAGEITPGYSALSRGRIRLVKRVVPRARLLVILRDPIERAWSQVVMDLVRRGDRDLHELDLAAVRGHLSSRGVIRRGEYTRMLDAWTTEFGPSALWIGFFEDVLERPHEVLSSVFQHLGVGCPTDWSPFPVEERFNPGSGTEPPDDVRELLVGLHRADLQSLARRFPRQVARWTRF